MSVVFVDGKAINLRGAGRLERRQRPDGQWTMVAVWFDGRGEVAREVAVFPPSPKAVVDRFFANYSLRLAGR